MRNFEKAKNEAKMNTEKNDRLTEKKKSNLNFMWKGGGFFFTWGMTVLHILEKILTIRTTQKRPCFESEVDSAKRLWDAGTDTPRVIEPRSVAHGNGLQGRCKQVLKRYGSRKKGSML